MARVGRLSMMVWDLELLPSMAGLGPVLAHLSALHGRQHSLKLAANALCSRAVQGYLLHW